MRRLRNFRGLTSISCAPMAARPALGMEEIKVFSRADIDELRADGRKTRAGIALISTLLGFSIGPVLIATVTTFAGIACLVAVPIILVLLYVMKIGPDSWHTPSI